MHTPIKIALDWVPNMLHAGLLYAYVQGWFQSNGLDPEIISPEIDSYSVSNERKLLSGTADIALMPAEIIFENNELRKQKILPFANILQKNTSAIFTLKSSGIERPSDLGGMRYGAIEIPYEVNIIRALIKSDGADSSPFVICPDRLSVWDELIKGRIDAAWAFTVVEGVEAAMNGIELNVFKFENYGIPYPGVPFYATTQDWKAKNPQTLGIVYDILNRGYQAAFYHPELVASTIAMAGLHNYTNDFNFNLNCINAMKDYYLDAKNQWGTINFQKLDHFRSWLIYQNLIGYENEAITITDLF